MLSIVADANIPRVKEAFCSLGDVALLDAESITPNACSQADILLVRSVTSVNESLLGPGSVKFVGSATAGLDHVDQAYLRSRGIKFASAPGSNADSVVEYVLTALLRLSALRASPLKGKTLGIIGCGHIGGRLVRRAPALGLEVLKNDPPLATAGQSGFVDLKIMIQQADILTLHVPKSPATHHLITDEVLRSLKPSAWLINTSRGNVVNSQDLKRALRLGRLDAAVLDVWENEPEPDLDLLEAVTIGTPHIAGHSVDGKLRGTIMLYHAVADHFDIRSDWDHESLLQKDLPTPISLSSEPRSNWLDSLAQSLYDLNADDARMRKLLEMEPHQVGDAFRELRRNYPARRAFDRHRIGEVPVLYQRAVRAGLRVDYL